MMRLVNQFESGHFVDRVDAHGPAIHIRIAGIAEQIAGFVVNQVDRFRACARRIARILDARNRVVVVELLTLPAHGEGDQRRHGHCA